MRQFFRQPRALLGVLVVLAVAATWLMATTRNDDADLPPSSMGVFIGFDRGDRLAEFERELGAPVRWVVTMLDSRSVSAMRGSALGQFVDDGAYLPELSDRVDVVVTVPLAFGSMGQSEAEVRANLLETAGGRWDDDYRVIAQHVQSAGFGDAVIRLGHEFDARWSPWSARNNAEEYVGAFRHVRNVLAAESSGFRFDWTTTRGGFEEWGPPAYPGDAYVDIIGMDIYWRGPEEISEREWTQFYESVLREHLDFARARNKPVSYPEWGRARADTDRYIGLMHGWFASLPESGPGRLLYQAYFSPGAPSEYNLDNLPNVSRAYFGTFGS